MEDGDEVFVCKVMRDILFTLVWVVLLWDDAMLIQCVLLLEFTCALLGISVYSPHILYIIFTYYLVHFWNSNLCIGCVLDVWSLWVWLGVLTQKTTYILCILYILDMCLFILEQRILIGLEPTIFVTPLDFAWCWSLSQCAIWYMPYNQISVVFIFQSTDWGV